MLKLGIGREVVVEQGHEVRFETEVEYVLELEHSLATLSKWEAIWEKPFIDGEARSPAEIISYIECMIQTVDYPSDALDRLTQKNMNDIDAYINAKMTATWFNEINQTKKTSSEKITNELVYYWLSNIPSPPPDYEDWHLNRLFTYIKIHDVKNSPAKKMNTRENLASRRELNERRKAEMGTRG